MLRIIRPRKWLLLLPVVLALSLGLSAVATALPRPAEPDVIARAEPRFGTIARFGWNAEHEKITVAAFGCASTFDPATKPNPCFQASSVENLAGRPGEFGAVGAADNFVTHMSGGPDWWHCDKADFMLQPGYPQSRAEATRKLNQCRTWAQALLGDGLKTGNDVDPKCRGRQSTLTYRCEGITEIARRMLNSKGAIDIRQPGNPQHITGCTFNGRSGRIKCLILQQLGYALHVIQDFYSHSNWTDRTDPGLPYSLTNPPGIGGEGTPAYWDLTVKDPPPIPNEALSTGCYPDKECQKQGRVTHATLNKDKGIIHGFTGETSQPGTPRGKITVDGRTNFDRAARAAIHASRDIWKNLQVLLAREYGEPTMRMMICAIATDTPNKCRRS